MTPGAKIPHRNESPNLLAGQTIHIAWFILVILGIYFILGNSSIANGNPMGTTLAVHIITSSLALLIGPVQFSKTIRKRWTNFHRKSGWVYIICILISALTTYVLSYRGFCQECIPSYFTWATVWLLITAMGLLMAIQRKFRIHKQFMIRSYVLLNIFFIIRIDDFMPLSSFLGNEIYSRSTIVWASWVIPLLITEFWISWYPALKRRRPAI